MILHMKITFQILYNWSIFNGDGISDDVTADLSTWQPCLWNLCSWNMFKAHRRPVKYSKNTATLTELPKSRQESNTNKIVWQNSTSPHFYNEIIKNLRCRMPINTRHYFYLSCYILICYVKLSQRYCAVLGSLSFNERYGNHQSYDEIYKNF